LEPLHLADPVALGHFLVNDSPARCHPLDFTRTDGAAVAQAVAVLYSAGQDVSDGLEATVRVPREAGEVIRRDVIAEIVQEEERVELGSVAEAKRAAQMHACAFKGWLGANESFNGSR